MNPRQVIVLWIIAVALGLAVALVKVRQQAAQDTTTERSPGDTLFEQFPAEQVAAVTIANANTSLTIRQQDAGWVVADRDEFPARTSNVLALLRTLGELKVAQATEAGPSFAPRFGMDENSRDDEERGVTAAFNDATGNEIARVSVGRMLESGGRFIRNHADESGFYTVNEMLHMFDPDPVRWLEDGFIRPEKIASVKAAEAATPDISLWHVTRDSEDVDFRLADGAPGEMLEASAGESLTRLMGFARFQDVVPAADVESRRADEPAARVATVETFEGFTYTFTIAPTAAGQDEQLLTVSLEATLPGERNKGEDESEEDAAELDQAFAERLEALTTQMEKELRFNNRTFVVTESVVAPLLKDRDEITTGPPEPDEPEDQATVAPPAPPRTGTSVTTPPIEIPAPRGD